jgi:hypothetical protein
MRIAVAAVCLLLAGCGPDSQPAPADGDAAARVARTEAEKSCAKVSGNTPEQLAKMAPDVRAMAQRDLDACIEKSMKEPEASLRGKAP